MMNETIRAAHERLSTAFQGLSYRLDATSGIIDGITVRDHLDRYLFAWHKHPSHLLFYFRLEALRAKSTLRQKAIKHHPSKVNKNPIGETTITLAGDAETETLLGWLLPSLPLPN